MIDQIRRNSNLSEILCLPLLPVSLIEIKFRVTEKRLIQHCLEYKSMEKKNLVLKGE